MFEVDFLLPDTVEYVELGQIITNVDCTNNLIEHVGTGFHSDIIAGYDCVNTAVYYFSEYAVYQLFLDFGLIISTIIIIYGLITLPFKT